MPRPLFHRNDCLDPLQEMTQKSLFDKKVDLPNFLNPDEVDWIESARKRLGATTWPEFSRVPLFSSLCMEMPTNPFIRAEGLDSEMMSEQTGKEQNWKICLDVRLFSPEEISIKTKDGYLEITGSHEEKHENHRFVSRSFTRKYKLPADLDLNQISTKLSEDGLLSVEAPVSGTKLSHPGEIIIPIHILDKQLSNETYSLTSDQ